MATSTDTITLSFEHVVQYGLLSRAIEKLTFENAVSLLWKANMFLSNTKKWLTYFIKP